MPTAEHHCHVADIVCPGALQGQASMIPPWWCRTLVMTYRCQGKSSSCLWDAWRFHWLCSCLAVVKRGCFFQLWGNSCLSWGFWSWSLPASKSLPLDQAVLGRACRVTRDTALAQLPGHNQGLKLEPLPWQGREPPGAAPWWLIPCLIKAIKSNCVGIKQQQKNN